ncbi:MAG: hypothetical protein AB1486_31365 [Planctomycetota bacterium]
MRILPLFWLLFTAHRLAGEAWQNPQEAQEARARHSHLELRQSPLVDLHNYLRKLSETRDAPPPEGFAEPAATVRAVGEKLGHVLAWGLLEPNLCQCETAGELEPLFAELPEEASFAGRPIALRAMALELAAALEETEAQFLEEVWPEHAKAVAAARDALEPVLAGKEAACLADMMEKLGMRDPVDTVPVYLVAESPWPGGVTHRRRDGGGVCFIGIDRAAGWTGLLETVLHESLHAFDVKTNEQATVLQVLRSRLQEAGLGARDVHDIVHTVMFAQAAATVQGLIDPAHRPYGEVSGYYRKVKRAAAIVLPVWKDYIDGKLSREQAIEGIVVASKPSHDLPPSGPSRDTRGL